MKRKHHPTTGSVFDAVAVLDHQDARAVKNQRRGSERERLRSLAAQSQTEIYSRLVETRILLQRSLVHGAAAVAVRERNTAVATTTTTTSAEGAGEEDENSSEKEVPVNPSAVIDQCNDLLAKLLEARRTLFPRTPIEAESDNENITDPDYQALVHNQNHNNSEQQLSNTLQSEFEHYQEGWKEVLDRRNKDLRLHSGATHKTQFRVMDASFWQQVENTVQHEELRHNQSSSTLADSAASSAAPPAIFDDSKVYQQLLKDFVAVRGAATHNGNNNGTLDPIQQRKQSKAAKDKKAPVDRRASKGRKIRYTEIQKLTNFTFPVHRSSGGFSGSGNDLDEDAWFKSLFGGAARSRF